MVLKNASRAIALEELNTQIQENQKSWSDRLSERYTEPIVRLDRPRVETDPVLPYEYLPEASKNATDAQLTAGSFAFGSFRFRTPGLSPRAGVNSSPRVLTSLPHEVITRSPRTTPTLTNPRIPEPAARPIAAGESTAAYGRFIEAQPFDSYLRRTNPDAGYNLLPQKSPDVIPVQGLNFSVGERKPMFQSLSRAKTQINAWMMNKRFINRDIKPGLLLLL